MCFLFFLFFFSIRALTLIPTGDERELVILTFLVVMEISCL